jgi:hypothetical protein
MQHGRTTLAIAGLACLPPLVAWAVFGVIETPDSPGYIDYARALLAGPLPSGPALLDASPSPVTLFRMPGFPALLAALQWLWPDGWRTALVGLQVMAGGMLAALAHCTALRLGLRPGTARLAALLPSLGFMVVVQVCVLTDAFYAVLTAGAALLLLWRDIRAAVLAGAMLAAAAALREATPYIALFYLPLALTSLPRLPRAGLVLLPCCAVLLAQAAWNAGRGAGWVVTTSRQTVMVQGVMELARKGYPVFPGDDAFDRVARETVGGGAFLQVDLLHRRLFAEAGMRAPEMARVASARYADAWRTWPLQQAWQVAQRWRLAFLALPFQPADTVGALLVYAGWPRPAFDRLDVQWTRLRSGDATAAGWIALDVLTRLAGTALGLAAVVLPWTRRGTPQLRALWVVCAGFVAVYLPVHIETRYLVPVVPLATLLALACLFPRFQDAAA